MIKTYEEEEDVINLLVGKTIPFVFPDKTVYPFISRYIFGIAIINDGTARLDLKSVRILSPGYSPIQSKYYTDAIPQINEAATKALGKSAEIKAIASYINSRQCHIYPSRLEHQVTISCTYDKEAACFTIVSAATLLPSLQYSAGLRNKPLLG